MKKLSIVFLFLLFYSALEAQILPNDPMFSPFTVVLDTNMAPVDPFIINSNNPPLTNLSAMRVTVITDSIDIYVEDLRLFIERQLNQPNIKSISLYDGATLLASKIGQDGWYLFGMQKIVIPKFSQKTLMFQFDEISGSGIIIPRLVLVQASGQTTGYYIFDKEVVGTRFNFVDPEKTEISYGRSTLEKGNDTLFVYPNQHWYLYEWYGTNEDNFLPNTIVAAKITANHKFDYSRNEPEFYIQDPQLLDDTLGYSFVDRSSVNAIIFNWISNYSIGVSCMPSFSRWGNNNLAIGQSQALWLNSEIVFSSPYFSSPRSRYFGSTVYVYSVDGIRGDVDGDGVVTKNDVYLMILGQRDVTETYHHSQIDYGRGLVLFSWPTLLDSWLINVWLKTPNDPWVKNLGIGIPMSQRPPLTPAVSTTSLSGQTMTIKTEGFAVNVSTVLPSGKIWNQAAKVVNGEAVIELPDANLKYQVEAVTLPNATTGVENSPSPIEFNLDQNYPNPFNPSTNIAYSLPKSSFVNLKIYDILGKEVATLVNEEKVEGNYSVNFDGSKLASGTYLCRLVSGAFSQTQKMVLMK